MMWRKDGRNLVAWSKKQVSAKLFFFQAEDGIRDLVRSRGLGDVYKRQRVMLVLETEFLPRNSVSLYRLPTPNPTFVGDSPRAVVHTILTVYPFNSRGGHNGICAIYNEWAGALSLIHI